MPQVRIVKVYHHRWRNLRNVVGFAATCARLALPLYRGEEKAALVRAIAIAEARARGETIQREAADAAKRAADSVGRSVRTASGSNIHNAADVAAFAAGAAAYAADAGDVIDPPIYSTPIFNTISSALDAADAAIRVIRTRGAVDRAFVRWVALDLGVALRTEEQIHAAVAAAAANEPELIAEIGVPC